MFMYKMVQASEPFETRPKPTKVPIVLVMVVSFNALTSWLGLWRYFATFELEERLNIWRARRKSKFNPVVLFSLRIWGSCSATVVRWSTRRWRRGAPVSSGSPAREMQKEPSVSLHFNFKLFLNFVTISRSHSHWTCSSDRSKIHQAVILFSFSRLVQWRT